MVYDGVNNPAAGGFDTDICPHSYCGADTYTHSSRANPDTDTWVNSNADADTNAYTDL
jgi:hypothetical protein